MLCGVAQTSNLQGLINTKTWQRSGQRYVGDHVPKLQFWPSTETADNPEEEPAPLPFEPFVLELNDNHSASIEASEDAM